MREKVELPDPDSVERVERVATSVPPEWYKPYGDSPSDVPPMANFGAGYRYHVTGLLHDLAGYPTQRLDEIDPWIERVHRKIERNVARHCDGGRRRRGDGPDGGRGLRRIGAQRPARRQAGAPAALQGGPGDAADDLAVCRRRDRPRRAHVPSRMIVPEMNLGQLALEVERVAGRHKVVRVNRADGEMVTPQMILEAIEAGAE